MCKKCHSRWVHNRHCMAWRCTPSILCAGNLPDTPNFLCTGQARKCVWNVTYSVLFIITCTVFSFNAIYISYVAIGICMKCHVYWSQEMCLKLCPILYQEMFGKWRNFLLYEMCSLWTGNVNYPAHFLWLPNPEIQYFFQCKIFNVLCL